MSCTARFLKSALYARPRAETKDDGFTRSCRSGHAGQGPRSQAEPSRCTSPLDAHTCPAPPPATRHGGTFLHNPARAGLNPQTALLPRPLSAQPLSTQPLSARPLSALAPSPAAAAAAAAAEHLLYRHLRLMHRRSQLTELHSLAQNFVELRQLPVVLHRADCVRHRKAPDSGLSIWMVHYLQNWKAR